MAEVVVIGSLMIDLTAYTSTMPSLGATVHGSSFEQNFGGKGANQAVQCARLGVKTAMVGKVGSDSYGLQYKNHLEKEGLHVENVTTADLSSGIASIWVDSNGGNSIIIIPGANNHLESTQVESCKELITNAKVVVFQNEIPVLTTEYGLKMVRGLTGNQKEIVSIFNPAPASEDCITLVPHCDILCLNETELSFLSKLPVDTDEEVYNAANSLLALGCKCIVATLGARGAAIIEANKPMITFAAKKTKAIDTVGAGDSFIGCMAARLSLGDDLPSAVQKAVVCASFSVLSKGAQPSYMYLKDAPTVFST